MTISRKYNHLVDIYEKFFYEELHGEFIEKLTPFFNYTILILFCYLAIIFIIAYFITTCHIEKNKISKNFRDHVTQSFYKKFKSSLDRTIHYLMFIFSRPSRNNAKVRERYLEENFMESIRLRDKIIAAIFFIPYVIWIVLLLLWFLTPIYIKLLNTF